MTNPRYRSIHALILYDKIFHFFVYIQRIKHRKLLSEKITIKVIVHARHWFLDGKKSSKPPI